MIDYASDFGMLNSLFSATWISVILAFGLSMECLVYQLSMRSCKALTSVSFFIFSSVTSFTSHTTLTTNQNWFGTSFPTPLNTGNFIFLATLTHGSGGGGTGEGGGEEGEAGGGLGGVGTYGILFLIIWIALRGETFASSSSSPPGGEIKGLVSGPLFPSFP